MNYELTEHAKESLQKRTNIRLEWLEGYRIAASS